MGAYIGVIITIGYFFRLLLGLSFEDFDAVILFVLRIFIHLRCFCAISVSVRVCDGLVDIGFFTKSVLRRG